MDILYYSQKNKILYKEFNIRLCFKVDKVADVADYKKLKAYIDKTYYDYIVNLVIIFSIKYSIANPLNIYNVNALEMITLYEENRKCNNLKNIVKCTTDKCYNLEANKSYIYDETILLGGATDLYSSSRACSEILTSSYIKAFFKYPNIFNIIVLRTGNAIDGGWTKKQLMLERGQSIINVRLSTTNAIIPLQGFLDKIVVALELLNQSIILKSIFKRNNSYNYGYNLYKYYSVLELVKLLIKSFMNVLISLCLCWYVRSKRDTIKRGKNKKWFKQGDCSKFYWSYWIYIFLIPSWCKKFTKHFTIYRITNKTICSTSKS